MDSSTLDPEELREAIRQVLGGRDIAIPDEAGASFDRALWQEMVGLGWLGLAVDEAHDGLGQGLSHLAVLFEELGRSLASVPVIPTLWAAEALRLVAADVQAEWLPKIAAGEAVFAGALEGEGGALDLTAGQLHGTVRHVVDADKADVLLLPVGDADGAALAITPIRDLALAITPISSNDLTRSLCTVEARGVTIGPANLLRLTDGAHRRLADTAAVALACDSIGGAAAVLERTIDYMRIRVQFDRPIGAFQALKHRAANWKTLLEAAIALTRQAADAVATGEPDASTLAACAKFYACDAYVAIAEDAIQLHGGIGFTWEHPCHLYLRRARMNQALLGSSRAFKDQVAALAFSQVAAPVAPDLSAFPAHDLMEPAS